MRTMPNGNGAPGAGDVNVLELGGSLGFLDELAEQFAAQPDAVDPSWRELLDGHGHALLRILVHHLTLPASRPLTI